MLGCFLLLICLFGIGERFWVLWATDLIAAIFLFPIERFFCTTHIYNTSIIQYTILKFRGRNKNSMFVIMFPFQTRFFLLVSYIFSHDPYVFTLSSVATIAVHPNWCLPVRSLQLCSWCEPSFLMVR